MRQKSPHQVRDSVHFHAAIEDQTQLISFVEQGAVNDSVLRIGIANAIEECDLPRLKLLTGTGLDTGLLNLRRACRWLGPVATRSKCHLRLFIAIRGGRIARQIAAFNDEPFILPVSNRFRAESVVSFATACLAAMTHRKPRWLVPVLTSPLPRVPTM